MTVKQSTGKKKPGSKNESYRILSLHAENIKRIKVLDIIPKGNVIEIQGKNAQGRVLRVFRKRECELLTPCDIMSILSQQGHCDLLTSVRRAMSNLTEMGLLEKTKHMKKGVYGKKVFCWRYSK